MDTDFIVLSETAEEAMVRCNCGHVQNIRTDTPIESIVIVCQLCGSVGEAI